MCGEKFQFILFGLSKIIIFDSKITKLGIELFIAVDFYLN